MPARAEGTSAEKYPDRSLRSASPCQPRDSSGSSKRRTETRVDRGAQTRKWTPSSRCTSAPTGRRRSIGDATAGALVFTADIPRRLKRPQKCQQIGFLGGGKFCLEHEIEELDCVFERQQPAI